MKELILKNKNIMRSILILALPVMFSNILKSIHDIVDMYFIARMNDTLPKINAQVAAITMTAPIISICQALATGLMIAGAALMSQYIGANQTAKAKKVSGQLLLLCILVGILFNILLYFACPIILQWMGADVTSHMYHYSVKYVQIRSFEQVGLFVFFAYQATRQSTGDTISPVILSVISVLLNILLTWLFINRFHMDITGAAYATVIANMIIIPICIICMRFFAQKDMKLELKDMKWDGKASKQIFMLGTPAALSQAFTSLGFLLINALIMGFDDFIITGIGIGNRINSLLLFPAMAVGTVLATFIGQNVGAKQVIRARQCFKSALILALLITGIGAAILMFLRVPLANIFLKENPQALTSCVQYLYFLLVGLPLMGIFQVFTGCFQGAGRTGFGLILASVRLWILRIPIIWIFIHLCQIGEASVWYAMTISNFGATILGTILYAFIDYLPRISKIKQVMQTEQDNNNASKYEYRIE